MGNLHGDLALLEDTHVKVMFKDGLIFKVRTQMGQGDTVRKIYKS